MIQTVEDILRAVATPFAASVLLPVVPRPARYIVSEVIAIVITPAAFSFTNVIAVPMG